MNAEIGRIGILISLVSSLAAVGLFFIALLRKRVGVIKHARSFALVSVLGVAISTFAIERALITHDFSIAFVAQNNSKETPLLFSISGMWSALQGSILLWALILGINLAALVFFTRLRKLEAASNWALLATSVTMAFFVAMMFGPANPFALTQGAIPPDGLGPNPLLQNYPLVAVHPPLLYFGFVSITIPFALWIGDLLAGDRSGFYRELARRWAVISFSSLTLGITLGAWWSYQVLGWGGFWAWDPVENAALMPWLFLVAYLHSAFVEKRAGSGPLWSYASISSAFVFTILGTYFTRSGVLQSVHAFSSSTLGDVLISFFLLVCLVSIYLGVSKFSSLTQKRPGPLWASRTNLIKVNNVVFVAIVLIVLLGTIFPLFASSLFGQVITVGAPYFNSYVAPLGALLLVLMALAPVVSYRGLPWRALLEKLTFAGVVASVVGAVSVALGLDRPGLFGVFVLAAFSASSTLEQLAKRSLGNGINPFKAVLARKNGGLLSHLGIVMVAIALASATSFGHKGEIKLYPGQNRNFFGQNVSYLGTKTVVTPAETSLVAMVTLNGRELMQPAISQFGSYTQPVGSPAVSAGLTKDVYLTLDQPPTKVGGSVLVGIIIQPMIDWLWIGASVIALGGVISILGFRKVQTKRHWGAKAGSSDELGDGTEKEGQATDRAASGTAGADTGAGSLLK
ncbi:MAG: heme lyase CcmF/NrfE family subunit [Acidimicrobiaceae bacterium]|nr:heme lyase CcmF/NrfE family subunit [Acidimicrobiaceae bacterium]